MTFVRPAIALVAFGLLLAAPAMAGRIEQVSIPSPELTSYWRSPLNISASVVVPESYESEPNRRYPVIYWFPALGGVKEQGAEATFRGWDAAFTASKRFIVVFPDPYYEGVYTAFADSANMGPWGDAFLNDVIPYIDQRYRTTGQRFLAGHSSGAWTALWLQTVYPSEFSGTWAYAPDPVDFRDWTDVDLTAIKPGNYYYRSRHDPYTIWFQYGRDWYTHERFVAKLTEQFITFNYVFSPRASNGFAARLFDLKTGDIDPVVAAYWEQHYDISSKIVNTWSTVGDALRGKIHIIVGESDTFHLGKSVHLMDSAISPLGAQAEFTYLPHADHWTILDWDGGYQRHIIKEASAHVHSI